MGQISEVQHKVNELMGVSDKDFLKQNKGVKTERMERVEIDNKTTSGCISIPLIESLQIKVNKALGIDKAGHPNEFISDTQLAVNKQMGIDNATFLKYNK